MKFLKFHEIWRSFTKIIKYMEIPWFCPPGGSKTLIFLRNYWCFCNVMNFTKFHFFSWKLRNPWFVTFSKFLKNFNENALFLKKRAHGAQDPPKCIVFHWFKQHSRQPAARLRKHVFSEKSEKLFRAFHEKMEIPWKSWNFQEFHDFRHVKTSSIS